MRVGGGWSSWVSKGLLIVASPLLVMTAWWVLVDWPMEAIAGLRQTVSGHDVIQLADIKKTGMLLYLLLLLALGVAWLVRGRMPFGEASLVPIYVLMLFIPIIAVLGIGAEYGLEGALAREGYSYCTWHTTSTGKGASGTYVYARDDRPGACDAARTQFPASKLVPDQTDAFDVDPD